MPRRCRREGSAEGGPQELALQVGTKSAEKLVPGLHLWPDFLSEEEGWEMFGSSSLFGHVSVQNLHVGGLQRTRIG